MILGSMRCKGIVVGFFLLLLHVTCCCVYILQTNKISKTTEECGDAQKKIILLISLLKVFFPSQSLSFFHLCYYSL